MRVMKYETIRYIRGIKKDLKKKVNTTTSIVMDIEIY